MKSWGRTATTTSRLALGVAGLAVLVLSWGGAACAAPVGRQFAPAHSPVVWQAVTADSTEESSVVTVDVAEVAPGSELPDADQLAAGQRYLYLSLHPNYEYAGVAAPLQMPPTEATLMTADSTVAGLLPPPSNAVDASWYFPVADTITAATLHVASFSKTIGNERGDFSTWTFSPATIEFVAGAPASATVPTPTPAQAAKGHVPSKAGNPNRLSAPQVGNPAPDGGSRLAVVLGAGVGGLAVLGAGGAALASAFRRRAFYRADRESRVVLAGPPTFLTGTKVAVSGALPPDRHGIVVKLLGWLEIEGTKRPITAGPLLELIVYLVLNPGRSFTSVQLRESIWGLGRQPITSATFRTYMVEFRKAFGSGVVITNVYRYELTEAVTSDWDQFRAALQADDELSGREEALALVRGPVLNGCFDGKKNSPFSWAVGTANDIEDEVTITTVDLAIACLDLDDPQRAAKAISKGLLCAESNLRLRTVDLSVGAALGGPREVGRRLEAARTAVATFPKDVADLEETARSLGWASAISG